MKLIEVATAADSLMLSDLNYHMHILQTTAPQISNKDNLE
jgi:hypothetical protein